MTKNAKIAVIVSILSVIVLIVVLCSTVFSIQNAQLIWYSERTSTLQTLNNETALKATNAQSKSVFLLDKEKAINNIQKKYPTLRVIKLEVAFPNILKIHATERQEVYALPISNNKYAITDEYFSVINIVNSFSSINTNAILINTDAFLNLSPQKSDVIDIFGDKVYKDIYTAFQELSKNLADFRAIIASATLTDSTLTLKTHQGTTLKLDKPFANTTAKMRLAIKTFDLLSAEDYPNSTIEVFVNNQNKLESRFYK